MIGSSAGYGHAGVVPWTDFAWDNWSLLAEFGYAPAISSDWDRACIASSRSWGRRGRPTKAGSA